MVSQDIILFDDTIRANVAYAKLNASEEEIIAYCRKHLAHFKTPKNIIFGPLPKTSTGKIQKFVLRERNNKE